MRQPLWILNSALLILLFFAIGFILLSRPSIPERKTLSVRTNKKITKEDIKPELIYENDLFGTFHIPKPAPAPQELVDQMPQAPIEQKAQIPSTPKPQFLEPLPIALTGIIVTGDSNDNTALIKDTGTQAEINYRVGDKIGDAQLIRIFVNKVVIIRSNGQQEFLYLTQEDAEADAPIALHGYWNGVIKMISEGTYKIDPQEFVHKIKSLGQLIDALDLTTAYKDGKSIGCRIGMLDENSLAYQLGLQTGDIIEQIDDILTVNTHNNIKIYEHIINKNKGDTISAIINRDNKKFKTNIVLDEITPFLDQDQLPAHAKKTVLQEKTDQEIEHEKIALMQKKYRFAPTVKEIQENERKTMWEQGRRGALPRKLQTHNRLSS